MPDFQTYLHPTSGYWLIEVTEVLRPGYRRGQFHRDAERSGKRIHDIPAPHPKPWSTFRDVLRKKLSKSYSVGTSLLIYDDMTASDFPNYLPWQERVLQELQAWTFDSATTCDITRSRYDNIFVVDASGVGALRLFPHWDVIRESPFPT